MEFAEKEHKKTMKKVVENKTKKEEVKTPIWFDKKIQEDDLTKEEEEELKDLLKEFN